MALRSLRISADEKTVYNPTVTSVFATVDQKLVEFKPGMNYL